MNFDADCDNGATIDADFGGVVTSVVINTNYTGTITLQRSLQTSSTFTQSGGVFNASDQTLDINSTFTMNTGAGFTAPSATMTVAGSFTINGGTFSHNSGTVTFDGTSSVNLTCASIEFSLVTFANTSGTKTVSTNCSLPLTNDTITGGGSITVNGTLTGSGTLTKTGGTLTLNSTAVLSDFTGLSVNALTISGLTKDFSSYSPFTLTSTLTLTSSIVTLPTTVTLVGLNVTNSTLTGNGTLTSSSNMNFYTGAVLSGFTGISTGGQFSNSGATIDLSSYSSFSVSQLGITSGTLTLPVGANVYGWDLTMSGGVLNVAAGKFIVQHNIVINGGTFNASDGTDLDRSTDTRTAGVRINGGTFNAPSGTIYITRNLTYISGTFNHNSGTVILNGNTQTLYGAMTFYNLTKNTTDGDIITFPASTTITVEGTLTLKGTASHLLTLASSTTGTQWNIDPQGDRDIEYVNVQDSNNINATAITAGVGSYDLGNNTNWTNLTALSELISTSTGIHDALADSNWWNYAWTWRKQLVFNNTSTNLGVTAESLTDFPVLVKLTSSNFEFSKAKSDGSDIRFLDSDHTTALSYEIEKWDSSAQQAFVWVKVPQIDANSSTDLIYMYYGNPSASDAQNVNDTWNSDYVGVWHLEESGNTVYDSTENAKNGTKIGLNQQSQTSSGQIDGAQYFDGSNDFIDLGNVLEYQLPISVSAWVKRADLTSFPIFTNDKTSDTHSGIWFDVSSSGYLGISYGTNTGDASSARRSGGPNDNPLSVGQWYYVVGIIRGPTDMDFYINGAATGESYSGSSNGTLGYSNRTARIGRELTDSNANGYIDEVRMSNISRSAAWVAAEYKNGIDEFINYLGQNETPTGRTISSNNSITSGDNGKVRFNGNLNTDKSDFIIGGIECSPNGAGYGGATATDGSFDEQSEDFYYDFLVTDNSWTGEGYTVVCRATRSGGVVKENLVYFTPFNLNSPADNETTNDNHPTFSFSVIKQHGVLKNALQKYQIQIRRKTGGSWNTYIDNIPVDKDDGTVETDDMKMTVSDTSSTIQVQSKKSSLSGTYIWRAVAVDKSGHNLESGTRNVWVKSTEAIDPTFPLAILNISGLGDPNISSYNPTDIQDSYTTYSTHPIFYGIAFVNSKVVLELTDTTCVEKNEPDCVKTYDTTTNADSRFGINVPTQTLISGRIYTTRLSASLESNYTELPSFELQANPVQLTSSIPSITPEEEEKVDPSPTPVPTIVEQNEPTEAQQQPSEEKKNCILFYCW